MCNDRLRPCPRPPVRGPEVEQHLQFRSEEQVRTDLAAAGLTVDRISSDWRRGPFDTATHRLMVVEARRGWAPAPGEDLVSSE